MRRQMEFILEHQARFSEDIDRLKEVQSQQGENIGRLFETVSAMLAQSEIDRAESREAISGMQAQAESDRVETREAINNLIIANEVTRKLSEDVARLTVALSPRLTNLELKQ